MAQYPSSAATDANLYVAVNTTATTLAGALTASGGNNGSDIEVLSTAGFPSVGFITIDLEAISYTSILSSPPRFSGITRGADGTTATSHSSGVDVKHNVIAAHHNVLKEEIKAIESDLLTTNPPLRLAGGTMTGNIAMGSNKITGLAAATADGDAVRYEQNKLIQLVSTTTSTQFSTTSTSFVDAGLSQAITPSSTSHKVKISMFLPIRNGGANMFFTVLRNSTNLGDATNGFGRVASTSSDLVGFTYVDSPSTTSSTTYKLQVRVDGGTGTFLVDSGTIGSIILEEVA